MHGRLNVTAGGLLFAAAVSLLFGQFIGCSRDNGRGAEAENSRPAAPAAAKGIPSLIDLGRTFCIPCKMMAPILEDLKKEYAGRIDVRFIDVGKNPGAARKYRIRAIPTQVFIDASGREVYRHVGFYPKEDILKKMKELGFKLN